MPAMSGSVGCPHCKKAGTYIVDLQYVGSNQMFRCSHCGYRFQVFSVLKEDLTTSIFDDIEAGISFWIRFKNGAYHRGFIEDPYFDDLAQLLKAFRDPKVDKGKSYIRKWDAEKQELVYLVGTPKKVPNKLN